jgi:2-dehydropantoate 2-reductase
LGGVANISAGLDAKGYVAHFIPLHDLIFGEIAGGTTERIHAVEATIGNAGFNARLSDAIMHNMWEKLAQLGLGAGITCLIRASIGDILAAPGGREAMFALYDECRAVAAASGFPPRDRRIRPQTHHDGGLTVEVVDAARHRTRIDHGRRAHIR